MDAHTGFNHTTRRYRIRFPAEAKVLEIGCGTGAVSRILAQWPGVAEVVGVDPSPVFIAKARALAQDLPNLTFGKAMVDLCRLPRRPLMWSLPVKRCRMCPTPNNW
jgi:trans-aconitate methyltransferase